MIEILSLWPPILLSSAFIFILSSIIHMALPWHKSDYPKLPMEDKFIDALRPLGLPPGDYMVPRPKDMAEMRSPEFEEKRRQGPIMIFTVMAHGPLTMAKNLIGWFIYSVVIGIFTAYVLARTLVIGDTYFHVFRIACVLSFLGYSAALSQMSIWYQRSWSITLKSIFDGLIYAVVTAVTFAWLWPH
jgi:hypothetical protein